MAEDDSCPFDDWLATLDQKARSRIVDRLDRLRLGNFGDCKAVGEGVYELRFFFGSGYRIYYAVSGRQVVLLLAGGSKKNQAKDIRSAKNFWNRYKAE